MTIAQWDDGYLLNTDPRREDPLYYYLREGGWGSAIGFEVEPLYGEHTASRVTIRVWPHHGPREAGLPADEWRDLYPRVISVLLGRFPEWSQVTLQSSRLSELAELGLVAKAFQRAGFSQTNHTGTEETWTRTSQPSRRWWKFW